MPSTNISPACAPKKSILDLPLELTDQIFDHLPRRDWKVLRLTCRHLYDAVSPMWARERKTDLSVQRLDILEKIANHPILSSYVRHLTLAVCDDHWRHGAEIHLERGQSSQVVRPHPGMERLRGILERLRNCRHLTLDPDGLFGWKGDAPHSLAEAIAILLNTMTDVGRELHKVEIGDCPASPSDGVSSGADGLQVLITRMPTQEGRLVWSGLHSLALGCNIADHGLEDFVIKALEHSRRLSDLELNGCRGGLTEGLMKRMFLAASGCRLTRLELLSARCTTDGFRVFLDQHRRTLRTFIFKRVHIQEGGWAAVLKDLSAGFPALREFELAWIKEDSPGKSFVHGVLRFPGLAEDVAAAEQQGWRFPWVGRWGNEPAGPQALGWSGPGVNAALERLVHCAVTRAP